MMGERHRARTRGSKHAQPASGRGAAAWHMPCGRSRAGPCMTRAMQGACARTAVGGRRLQNAHDRHVDVGVPQLQPARPAAKCLATGARAVRHTACRDCALTPSHAAAIPYLTLCTAVRTHTYGPQRSKARCEKVAPSLHRLLVERLRSKEVTRVHQGAQASGCARLTTGQPSLPSACNSTCDMRA